VAPVSVRVCRAPPRLCELARGTLVADGTEQVVVEHRGAARVVGYVDLHNMEEGDSVVIRQYVRLRPDGPFEKYAEERYDGPQPAPVVYVKPKECGHGVRVTIQQVAGAPKSFDYCFLKEG